MSETGEAAMSALLTVYESVRKGQYAEMSLHQPGEISYIRLDPIARMTRIAAWSRKARDVEVYSQLAGI